MSVEEAIKQKAKITIENLIKIIRKLNYSTGELFEKKFNYEFYVFDGENNSKNFHNVKVQVYFGKKGVKTIISGNKNSQLVKTLEHIIYGKLPFEETEILEPEKYIGTDESGKGDFFGPIIICAFFYDNSIREKLIEIGVKDSKLLNTKEIKSIYDYLVKNFSKRISIVEIHPERYNQLYSEIQNLNKILIWAHQKSIENLNTKFDYDTIIVDKFSSKISFNKKFLTNKKLIIEEKAERFLGVAAASIIARARLINWFDKKSKELGIKLQLGASNLTIEIARVIKLLFGEKILAQLIKLHFKNFKNI
jgi:ribonuclease HIII